MPSHGIGCQISVSMFKSIYSIYSGMLMSWCGLQTQVEVALAAADGDINVAVEILSQQVRPSSSTYFPQVLTVDISCFTYGNWDLSAGLKCKQRR